MRLWRPDLADSPFHRQSLDLHPDLGRAGDLHVFHHLFLPRARPHGAGLRERPDGYLRGRRQGRNRGESVREGVSPAGLHPGFRLYGLLRRPLQFLADERQGVLLQVPPGQVPVGLPSQVFGTERALVQLPAECVRRDFLQADRRYLRPPYRVLFSARQHGEPGRPVRRDQVRLPHRHVPSPGCGHSGEDRRQGESGGKRDRRPS